jgi:hypothetical protein
MEDALSPAVQVFMHGTASAVISLQTIARRVLLIQTPAARDPASFLAAQRVCLDQ